MTAPEPRYLVYSVTKTFVAVLFCRLADRGELSLDDRLAGFVDDERLPDVSLRQLLDHTAGVPDYADAAYGAAVRARPGDPWGDEELLANALARPQRDEWTYSNAGYLLLRRILDEGWDGGFAGLLDRELTGPLGMGDTRLALELDDLLDLEPGLSSQIGAGRLDVRGRYHPRWVGHRSAISSVADLRLFWASLAAGRLLGPSFDDLLRFVPVGVEAYGFRRPSYGLGVMADPEWPQGVLIGHGGGGPGYAAAAFAVVRPEPAVAVVLRGEEDEDAVEEAVRLLERQVTESRA